MNTHKQMAYDINSAIALLSIGRTKLYEEINSGRLKAIKVGRKTLITAKAMDDWLSGLENSIEGVSS